MIYRDAYRYAQSIVRGLDTTGAETPVKLNRPLPSMPVRERMEDELARRSAYAALRCASAEVWSLGPAHTCIAESSSELCAIAEKLWSGLEIPAAMQRANDILDDLSSSGWDISAPRCQLCVD